MFLFILSHYFQIFPQLFSNLFILNINLRHISQCTHKPSTSQSSFIFNLNPSEIADLLRIATSAEGYIIRYFRKNLKLERDVGFSCNHPLLKRDFKKLFEIVGVRFIERENRLFISNKKEKRRF